MLYISVAWLRKLESSRLKRQQHKCRKEEPRGGEPRLTNEASRQTVPLQEEDNCSILITLKFSILQIGERRSRVLSSGGGSSTYLAKQLIKRTEDDGEILPHSRCEKGIQRQTMAGRLTLYKARTGNCEKHFNYKARGGIPMIVSAGLGAPVVLL